MGMDARLYAPGEEVTVVKRSRAPRAGIRYQGIVVPGRAPEKYLHMSVGGRLVDIPWAQIKSAS